jgi:CheY-like chemotaxis protein
LSEFRWQGADLKRLVEDELAPYRIGHEEKILATGPDVNLPPASAQTVALTVHELATNAAKYGALSSSTGKLSIAWELSPRGLELQWIESGGPRVRVPSSVGYGTRIITASVESQLSGRAIFEWRPEGLRCIISIPQGEKMDLLQHGHGSNGASHDGADKVAPLASASAHHRMLIAEDEALVAIMMEDIALELGWSVIGPFANAADALAAAKADHVDAAILDINLGGESVYPVADTLALRGVPFVFTTGYGAESIDPRFSRTPVLHKPIDRKALESVFAADGPGSAAAKGERPRAETG